MATNVLSVGCHAEWDCRLERTLSESVKRRQKLVASNIANVDTPGYRAKDIDFQHEFLTLTHGANQCARSGRIASRRETTETT
jgi:flagellar basal-body rod protein FlgB